MRTEVGGNKIVESHSRLSTKRKVSKEYEIFSFLTGEPYVRTDFPMVFYVSQGLHEPTSHQYSSVRRVLRAFQVI